MNRRKLLTVLLPLVFVIGTWILFSYYRSFKTLNIILPSTDREVVIFKFSNATDAHGADLSTDKNEPVRTLGESAKVRLQSGFYVLYAPEDEEYSEIHKTIDLKTDSSISLEYSLNNSLLNEMLEVEFSSINDLLTKTYTNFRSYKLDKGSLYGDGGWYYSTIKIKQSAEQEQQSYVDVYRVVLRKENDNWTIAAEPQLVISSADYPAIPKEIIRLANDLK